MSELSVDKQIDTQSILDFFESRIEALAENTRRNYRIVINSLRTFMESRGDASLSDPRVIEDWHVALLRQQLTPRTAAHYIDYISSLYASAVKEGLMPPTDTIRIIKSKVKALGGASKQPTVTKENFRLLLNIAKTADRQKGETGVYTDILLFSLLNRGMALSEVAMVTKSEMPGLGKDSAEIAGRHVEARRRYIFPVGQALRTPRQLKSFLNEKMEAFFRYRNLPIVNDSVDESIKSLWAYAALECGASASQTVSALGCSPAGVPALSICTQTQADPEVGRSLEETVAAFIFNNPQQWYAMKLRRGIGMQDIEKRLALYRGEMEQPEIFYPCEEIARRIGKKLVYCNKPLISDVAFFRCRATDIRPLFSRIGDMAWCYRGCGGSHYAVIPAGAMARFQEAIGMFTSDYQLSPIGSLTPKVGERVVIIGGVFAGRDGFIEKISTPAAPSTTSTLYRILLPDSTGFEWRVDLDSRLVRRAK